MDAQSLPLREIHLPAPPGLWPLATGWWVLLGGLIVAVLCMVLLRSLLKYKSIRKIASLKLVNLRRNQRLSDQQKLQQLSILLRRVSISAFPRNEVAGLTGKRWLEFLDRILDGQPFSQGPGTVLLDEPYKPMVHEDLDAVFELSERWINALPKKSLVHHRS